MVVKVAASDRKTSLRSDHDCLPKLIGDLVIGLYHAKAEFSACLNVILVGFSTTGRSFFFPFLFPPFKDGDHYFVLVSMLSNNMIYSSF